MEPETENAADWAAWHGAYDDPESNLSRRLATVRERIREVLDGAPPGPLRAVSLCAGEGRDLIGVLADHPRRGDVTARLVELDEGLTSSARAAAAAAGLDGIEVVTRDASWTGAYAGAVPAWLVLACGIFGNVTEADIERTIGMLPRLCGPGAHVIWTRNRREPDMVPQIGRWFEEHGFEERWLSPSEDGHCVGVHRFAGEPVPLGDDVRMFEFIGYYNIWTDEPAPAERRQEDRT
ncbi:SAM-dependent methyltransferase [Actinomadura opuntiae]|uniref:SAM-dependent methyltransferase n=1 Tax=Actinomadura sp. OS1-43 TaxID=604315 RepID=UPI00255AFB4A|nr:SAM-dependent methyltransferase [Actinomadura sp. OS1-43]MDL4815793.1 SAM-dependent methyltransferase [Actinomadura sp. OS1-43]